MAKSRYKSIKIIIIEQETKEKIYGLAFQERNFTDTKWLNIIELKYIKDQIDIVLNNAQKKEKNK